MMATTAMHLTGDISREKPDLCIITSEDTENFIGNWVFGYGFMEVKFPKNTTRELTDEEKDEWHGKVIGVGDRIVGMIWTKEVPKSESDESPIITLPFDGDRTQMLQNKLEEYGGRIDPHVHPGLQMGDICKHAVLARLLRDGQVNCYDLSLELGEIYGAIFDVYSFNIACGVVDDYATTGGQNVSGGTGLKV